MTPRKARRRRGALPAIAATAVAFGAFSAPALAVPLTVDKTVSDTRAERTYDWSIAKTVDPLESRTSADTADVTWRIEANPGASVLWTAEGTISVGNPDANAESIGFELQDVRHVIGADICQLRLAGSGNEYGGNVLNVDPVAPGTSTDVDWRCQFTSDPGAEPLTNRARVRFQDPDEADADLEQVRDEEPVSFSGVEIVDTNQASVAITDERLPTINGQVATPDNLVFTAPETLPVPALGCDEFTNVASVPGKDPVSATSRVCREIVAPVVTKTANGAWLRVFDWKIAKRADSRSGYNHRGSFVRMGYTIDADRRVAARKGFRIGGAIRVDNPNSVPLTLTDVSDVLSQGGAAYAGATCTVADAPTPATPAVVPANDRLVFRYRCVFANDTAPKDVLGAANAFSNTATVDYVDDVDSSATASSEGVEVVFSGRNRRDLFDRVRVTDRLGDTVKILSRDLDESTELRDVRYLLAPRRGCVRHVNVARLIAVDSDGKVIRNADGQPRLREVARETVRICQKATPSGADPAPVVYSSEDPDQGAPAARVRDQNSERVEDPTVAEPGAVVDRPERLRVRTSVVGRKRVEVGDRVVFRIAVRNRGDETARNARVRHVLPAHLRATAVRGKTRAVRGLKRRVLNLRLANIPAGRTRVIKVVTRVVSRPKATPRNLRIAGRAKGAKRRIAIARLEKGIACSVAIGRARAFRPDRDGACIRILAREVTPS